MQTYRCDKPLEDRQENGRRYMFHQLNLRQYTTARFCHRDFDTVLVQSSVAIPAPISITGDAAQQRHVFFTAQEKLPRIPEPVNVVTNGGFENGSQVPDFWQTYTQGKATLARIVGNSPEGAAHLEVQSNDSQSYAYGRQSLNVNPGWPSLISAQASFNSLGNAGYVWFSSGDKYILTDEFAAWLGSSPWGVRPTNFFLPTDSSGSIGFSFGWGSAVSLDAVKLLQWNPSKIDGFDYVRHLTGSTAYSIEGVATVRGFRSSIVSSSGRSPGADTACGPYLLATGRRNHESVLRREVESGLDRNRPNQRAEHDAVAHRSVSAGI